MQNRAAFVSALAVIVPVLLVLIVVVALARPSGDAMPAKNVSVPTLASALVGRLRRASMAAARGSTPSR